MEIIDVHSHIVSPEYLNVLKKYGKENEDGFPTPSWSIEEQLEYMSQLPTAQGPVVFHAISFMKERRLSSYIQLHH